jgi:hypothetical protein
MKLTLKKELPLIELYWLLLSIWLLFEYVTEKVPTHWNYKGEVDKWGDKYSLIALLFYCLF